MTDTKGCLCPVYGWENDGGEFDPTRAGGANGFSFYEYRITRYMTDVRRYIKDFFGLKKYFFVLKKSLFSLDFSR